MLLKELLPPSLLSDEELANKDIKDVHLVADKVAVGDIFISTRSDVCEEEFFLINKAIKNGAQVVLKGKKFPFSHPSVLVIEVDNIQKALSCIASKLYALQPDVIVGVTGTCGKSSVVSFLNQLWKGLGYKSASIGTLGVESSFVSAEGIPPYPVTTPRPLMLHYFLDSLSRANISHVALELSSEGLDQHRADHVNLKAGAFTNFDHDHLNYHGSLEAYFKAKSRLFSEILPQGSLAVLNKDDSTCGQIAEICKSRQHSVVWVGNKQGDLSVRRILSTRVGTEVFCEIFGKRYDFHLPLVGEFQAQNVLFTLALVIGLGENIDAAIKNISCFQSVRGRMELVGYLPNHSCVYVDYAHKPLALEKSLRATRALNPRSLTVVFGCGGNRDMEKRPMMGSIAAKYADKVIVTDDNPRNEDPQEIRAQIISHCPQAREIPCRRSAIQVAISELEAGDACLIAGKGHEQEQILRDEVIPFDDKKIATEAIEKIGSLRPA